MEFTAFLLFSGLISSAIAADCQWTEWLDRDNPSGTGDWEHLGRLGHKTCDDVQDVQARRKSDGKSPEETGVAFSAYDTDRGFICENAKQTSGNCDDYEVRFCCAVARCEWTRWLDRDDPGGTGDWEHLEGLQKDLGACSNPAEIQARRKLDQKPAEETGESFRAYGPDSGFVCVNEEQEDDGRCQDYEVRLCCPAT